MRVLERIDHVALTVRDVERAAEFYTRLGFATLLKIPRATFLQCGDAILALFPADPDARPGKARGSVDRGRISIQHVAFRVPDGSLEEWRERLEQAGSPTRGPIDHELNRSLYLEDPDGHQLELTHPLPYPR
ncbi:MAG: VOC family protein [Armatimonadetes bacterium]|nr:VOC family protein [Armatimonadota bacterium]